MSPLARLSALLLATCLAVGTVLTLASPASAAWRTVTTVHDAKLQACRATVDGGPAIKFRLDNRAARHQHRGAIFRERDGRSRGFEVRPAAGRISAVRAVPLRPGDRLVTLVGEIDGPAAGGGISRSDLPRC